MVAYIGVASLGCDNVEDGLRAPASLHTWREERREILLKEGKERLEFNK
jgi:hypothetical protein